MKESKEFFESQEDYENCYIIFPKSYNLISEKLVKFISEKFTCFQSEPIIYDSDNQTMCDINEKLKKSCIVIIGYLGNISYENCYQLGLSHAHEKQVILIRLPSDPIKNKKLPNYIRHQFLINIQEKEKEVDEQKIQIILKELEEKTFKILNIILTGIDEIIYQKAVEVAKNLEKRYQKKDKNLTISLNRDYFKKSFNKQHIKSYSYLYLNNTEALMNELQRLIVKNNNKLFNIICTEKIKSQTLIRCNCIECINSNDPHYFPRNLLEQCLEKGVQIIQCQTSFQTVNISKLTDKSIDNIQESFHQLQKDKTKKNQPMKTIKIFLASSSELKDDRQQFEIFINRKNKEYVKDGLFLELVLWEDFIDAMSATRLQDEYNKAVEGCDIFVSLFHTKVGKYTEEEFLKALQTFKDKEKPLIYTYFKDEAVNMSQITDKILTLINFKKKLSDLGHFYTNYADINDLKYKFGEQLIKVLPKLTGISATKLQQYSGNEIQNTTKIEQHFHGTVGIATGNVEGNQNLKDTNIKGDRHIKIGQGNYNERIEGDYIQGNYTNQSRTQNISGGTINASGAGAFSLGDISGTVANTINQLPTSPDSDQPGIKELLTKLGEAISTSEDLDEKRKTKAFKQIEALATAAQNPTDEDLKDSAEYATFILEKIVSKLPAAAALVTICKEVLPAISHFFGL